MTIRKIFANVADRVLVDGDVIRFVNSAFAYSFKEARLKNTAGSNMEHNKYVGQVSKIMTALTSNEGDLLSLFEKIDESEAQIENTSLKHLLIDNHDVAANKGKIKRILILELIFGFCRTIKKM